LDLKEKIFPLLEKGKSLRELFEKGENPTVSNYLMNELVELTFDVFHGYTMNEWKHQSN
jgi:hypothetical protein